MQKKIYEETKDLIDSGRYLLAIEKLNYLKGTFPYSYYAKYADLLMADIYFLQENYEEASISYILFRDLHPQNEKIPYVLYKIAESFYKQIPSTHDRDLSMAVKAMVHFEEMKLLYPGSKYLKGVDGKIKKCKNYLRNKEKYIADFYFKTEVYLAAKIRYLRILQLYKKRS